MDWNIIGNIFDQIACLVCKVNNKLPSLSLCNKKSLLFSNECNIQYPINTTPLISTPTTTLSTLLFKKWNTLKNTTTNNTSTFNHHCSFLYQVALSGTLSTKACSSPQETMGTGVILGIAPTPRIFVSMGSWDRIDCRIRGTYFHDAVILDASHRLSS